ncbi:hypothetical protein ACFL02_04465, partial [Planctomycetota bacterium]
MTNHNHNNPTPPGESSNKTCFSPIRKITASPFLRRWAWTAGILGAFILVVLTLWGVTSSQAAHNAQLNPNDKPVTQNLAEPTEAAHPEEDEQISELISQIKELVVALNNSDAGNTPIAADAELIAAADWLVNDSNPSAGENAAQTADAPLNDQKKTGEQQKTGDQKKTDDQKTEQQKKTTDDQMDKLSDVERKLFELFDKYAEALEKDPDSAETLEISRQLDAAFEQLDDQMASDPNTTLDNLPAKKPDDKKTIESPPDKKQAQTKAAEPPDKQHAQTKAAEPPVKQQAQTKATEPPVKQQAQTKAAKPPVKQQAQTKAAKPPTGQKQAARTGNPPVKPKTAAQTKELPVKLSTVVKSETLPVITDEDPADAQAQIPSPNDVVILTVEKFQLDIEMLIELVCKEFELNILYQDPRGLTGTFRFQQYGPVYRRDLIPLLESLLQFKGFTMVREGSVIHISRRAQIQQQREPLMAFGTEMPEVTAGDSILCQIVEIKHASLSNVTNLLNKFIPNAAQSIIQIPNTNFLVITEYTKRMPRVLELIKLIDQPGPSRKLVPLQVKYIGAQQASTVIQSLINQLGGASTTSTPAPTTRAQQTAAQRKQQQQAAARQAQAAVTNTTARVASFYVDDRTGRLFVIGTDDQIEQVKNLLELIDVEQLGADIKLVSLPVTHIPAKDA